MCGQNTTPGAGSIGRYSSSLLCSAALTLSLIAAPAFAQSTVVLEEITVTAQKREQSLQDVPASVSTISGDTVNDYLGSAENIRALAGRVPSLQIESSNGRIAPRFYIRGLGNIDFDVNANQPVAMVFDEIGLENNVLRSLPVYDIDRVEVLKGPQGSLFGRNTNAGIVKIDSVRPSFDYNGFVTLGYGQRDTATVIAAVGGPLSDTLAARVSVKHQERDNWINNLAAGTNGDDFGAFDESAYRIQALWQKSDSFRALVKFHGFRQTGSQPQVFYANAIAVGSPGLRPGFDEEVANHDGSASMELRHNGVSANLEWDLEHAKFTSITAYDTVENFQSADVDGGLTSFNDPGDIGVLGRSLFANVATGDGLDDHHQLTQEFRVSRDSDRLFTQIGLFFFEEEFDVLNLDTNSGVSDIVRQKTHSGAAFGQVDISLTDSVNLIVGGRVTRDDKNLEVIPGPTSSSPAAIIEVDDSYFNWDVALNFNVNDDLSVYGRVANASRGPVTLGRFGFTSSAKTETSNSGEIGFKATLMGGRARWNAAIYAFENDDHQLTATGGAGNVNQLLNADKVTGNGFETDFEILLTDNFRVIANYSYNDTEIDDPNLKDDQCASTPSCTGLDPVVGTRQGFFGPLTEVSIDGNPLPRSPESLANIIVQWTIPLANGSLYANTDWNYRDDSNIFLHESVEFVAEERWLGGLRIGYRNEDNSMDFAIVGRNITDEIVVDGAIQFLNLTAFINEPAYWGAEFRWDF